MGKDKKKRLSKRTKGKSSARRKAKEQTATSMKSVQAVEKLGTFKSKIITEQPSDDAPIPTDDNGNSHPAIGQSHNSDQNVARLGNAPHSPDDNENKESQLHNSDQNVARLDNGPDSPDDNENNESYCTVASKMSNVTVTEKRPSSSFHIVKSLLSSHISIDNSDSATVVLGSKAKCSGKIRMSMMIAIPGANKGIDEDEAPLEAIRKMNNMVKSLINKIPSIKLIPWVPQEGKTVISLLELPEDVDIVEKYIFDYNRFVSPGGRIYCRLHLSFDEQRTNKAEISAVANTFKKPRMQFLQPAHSDSTSPVQMGTFTGSVKSMADSPDFGNTLKKMFRIKHIGLWWTQPKSELSWSFSPKKFVVHYEIDRSDLDNHGKMVSYFNQHSSSVDKNMFGTPMSIAPIFTPFLDDEVKLRITRLAKKQLLIGNNIKSISITGTQILNWADKEKENTLHRELMQVESIYNKKVITATGTSNFKGRLFYAIITNQKTKAIDFYFSKSNAEEARSVARGLPLFIRDDFRLDPTFFCSSEAIADALAGEWNHDKRIFLTAEEKDEKDKFQELEMNITSEKEVFISQSHQQALATENDDIASVETRLTKGDVAPPKLDNPDDVSALTGETRESKAKAYAAAETKKVASQYIATIEDINASHNQEMEELRIKLAAALAEKQAPLENKDPPHRNYDDMSGLSSSSGDDEPIIVGVRRTKAKMGKATSLFRKKINNKNEYDFDQDSYTSVHRHRKSMKISPDKTSRYPARHTAPPASASESGSSL